jgi:FkbM family methyltransferase
MLKSILKRAFYQLGFDVRRFDPVSSEGARLMAMFSAHRINLVFDVGANIGQFGQSLRSFGYRGRIVSFEPLLPAWDRLVKTSRRDPQWEVAARTALGSEDGEIEMNVASNSVSSSVLTMLDAHVKAAPHSVYVKRERLPLRRLDSIGPKYIRDESIVLIKIDTQGFEAQVLEGASGILARTVGLHLELSLVPLYEGQSLYLQMIGQLISLGFELWAIIPGFTDPSSGRLLQVDAVFFRA